MKKAKFVPKTSVSVNPEIQNIRDLFEDINDDSDDNGLVIDPNGTVKKAAEVANSTGDSLKKAVKAPGGILSCQRDNETSV